MATTTNKGIEKPTYQQYALDPTGWTNPINANWDVIDKAFGGTYSVPALTSASSDVTLTTTQCQNVRILLSGTATTPKTINIFFPATISGFFIIDNATSGPFTFNIKVTGATISSEYVVATQSANTFVWVDSTTVGVYLADNSPLTAGTGITVSGSTVSLTTPVSVANGGTGTSSYTAGQLLIGNNAGGLTAATLTAGSNITITNGNGSITIGASGSAGGVTTFSGGSTGLTPSVATAGAVTLGGTLGVSNGGTGTSSSTGSGSVVLSSSPTITTPTISGILTAQQLNLTGSGGSSIIGFNGASSTQYIVATQSTNTMGFFLNGALFSASTANFNAPNNFSVNGTPFANQTNFTLISDERTKKDIRPYLKSLNDVITLDPVTYEYNGQYGTPDDGVTRVGLIAQQVNNTPMSEMVGTYVYTDPNTGVQTTLYNLNPSDLMFAFINSIKALEARVKDLEAKVAATA